MAQQPAIHGEWSWGDDQGGFTPYPAQVSATIEAAFSTGQHTVNIQIDQGHRVASYLLDFDTMIQTNQATQFVRPLYRRLAAGAPDPSHTFSWMDNYGQWVPMDRDICALLSMMHTHGYVSVHFYTLAVVCYQVHFQTLRQVNEDTGKSRSIQITANQQAQAPPGRRRGRRSDKIDDIIARSKDVTSSIGDNEICSICHDGYDASNPALELPSCPHAFHEACVREWLDKTAKCPVCSFAYAPQLGNMPPGTMKVTRYQVGQLSCGGYANYGTIQITYSFNGGVQTADHPNPGVRYAGTRRTCYLPDNDEGKELLTLLQRAFDQRLMFTIGRSLTTGMDNSIVWASIHMKTSPSGGASQHGYPDPGYLGRLRSELKAKGIE